LSELALDAVRRRRLFAARLTQAFQIFVQNRVFPPTLAGQPLKVPLIVWLLDRWPAPQGWPARFIGIGARPEHVSLAHHGTTDGA
jgi:hypothetical protein